MVKFSSVNRGFPAGNPIANVFVVVVGGLLIALSIVVGFVAFVVLGSIVAVLAAVVGLRMWWIGRRLRSRPPGSGEAPPGTDGRIIEGEFHVVEDHRDPDA